MSSISRTNWPRRWGGNNNVSPMNPARTTFTSATWISLSKSLPFDVGAVFINVLMGTVGTMQIGTGAASSQVPITDPIMMMNAFGRGIVVPVTIPKGTAVWIMNNATSGTTSGTVSFRPAGGRWLGRRSLRALNQVPVGCATSGVSGTPGTWNLITASSPACAGLIVNAVSSGNAQKYAFEIGVGSSQVSILGGISIGEQQIWEFLEIPIPQGSEVWARAAGGTTTVDTAYVQLLGLS